MLSASGASEAEHALTATATWAMPSRSTTNKWRRRLAFARHCSSIRTMPRRKTTSASPCRARIDGGGVGLLPAGPAHPARLRRAHYNLANVLHGRGKLDEALAGYRLALRLKPDYIEALNNLGNILVEQRKHDEAAACYVQALRFRPDCARTHYNLGMACWKMQKFDEAAASCQQAVRLDPKFAEPHNVLGIVFQEQGKLEPALASLHEALRLRPNYVEAINNVAAVLQDQGKSAEGAGHVRAGPPARTEQCGDIP